MYQVQSCMVSETGRKIRGVPHQALVRVQRCGVNWAPTSNTIPRQISILKVLRVGVVSTPSETTIHPAYPPKMSSFDPLSGSSTTYKSEPDHPLSAPELPFHDDDDDWVPPTLPGEENLARPFASGAVGGGRSGSRNSARRGSPLDEPLDPLLHSLQDDRSSNGVTERSLENPGAFGSRWMASTSTPAVEHSNGSGARYAGDGTLRSADDDFSRRQAVGARNMGIGGGTEFGTGEAATTSSGADGSHLAGVRLRLGYPSFKIGGAGIFKGGNEGMRGVPRSSGPPKDPLDSEWHKYLLRDKQVWVPDSVAAACMVCSRPFNLVFRRHHCRRCGACMCGGCSHMAVSDKVLSVNHHTGDVIRIHSGEAVRCCTKCTVVLDYQLSQALQRKGWRARSDATAPTERGTPRGLSSVPTTGGSYVASLPRHSQMDETESFDGGGFAPPSSDQISRTRAGLDSRRGMQHRGFGDDYGAAGNASRGTPNEGFRDKQLGEVDQRQPRPQMSSPSPPPRFEQPPQEQGVPSWLGKRTLGSQNTAGGGGTSRDGPEVKIREKQEVRTMSPPPEAFCDEENATDWSNSRAVV